MVENISTPRMGITQANSRSQRLNTFLDTYILPYPVKYLTNRLTIIATLCLLIPLIALANVQVLVLAANSYLNVMSVVVSSTVLLYSTISEARERAAAQRREEIARMHEEIVERRAQADHELIGKIKDELAQHVNQSLADIQRILVEHLTQMQAEGHLRAEAHHQALIASVEAHRHMLEDLNMKVEQMKRV